MVVSEADKIAVKLAACNKKYKSFIKTIKKTKPEKNIVTEPNKPNNTNENNMEIQEQDNVADEAAIVGLTKLLQILLFYDHKMVLTTLYQGHKEAFQKEVYEKIEDVSEKIDQLMTLDDSYCKNLASRICKTQPSLLRLYPDESEFKKWFEEILEQEKPEYIERYGSQ
ncbi:hypothetical protein C1645_835786 [Glomus cerebriforme]|uniref:Uncharacterized protein n=1 Tax=Glomus cerebriforme TaxID=658196 RepID=A0A397S722_9GLOM|nr:hypothetical protein C1645_835786 [Glomus cerebriforme]